MPVTSANSHFESWVSACTMKRTWVLVGQGLASQGETLVGTFIGVSAASQDTSRAFQGSMRHSHEPSMGVPCRAFPCPGGRTWPPACRSHVALGLLCRAFPGPGAHICCAQHENG